MIEEIKIRRGRGKVGGMMGNLLSPKKKGGLFVRSAKRPMVKEPIVLNVAKGCYIN